MDLFSQHDPEKERLSATRFLSTWVDDLPSEVSRYVNRIMVERVNREYLQHDCYPHKTKIYRIYRDLPLHKVKVVILGQDPYADGQAIGYAFGCKNKIQPSLKKILEGIWLDYPEYYKNPTHPNSGITLKYLVDQGVMLLNTALTVRAGQYNSHAGLGWNRLIIPTIQAICKRPNIVWMLWGGSAKRTAEEAQIQLRAKDHLILEYTHPAYAHRQQVTWNPGHFKLANEWLKDKGKEEIVWF